MPISIADVKKRIVLPAAKPGDVFEIQSAEDGHTVLVRLERPAPGPKMSKTRCLAAIASAPLRPKTSWDALRAITREP